MPVQPDLSSRPHKLVVTREIGSSADEIYRAWTEEFDRWFAAPGTLLMKPELDRPFFFETHFKGQRHPHYGRFLRLEPVRVIELAWVTGVPGTGGAETVIVVELSPHDRGTELKLTHKGFYDGEATSGHREGWEAALRILEEKLTANAG